VHCSHGEEQRCLALLVTAIHRHAPAEQQARREPGGGLGRWELGLAGALGAQVEERVLPLVEQPGNLLGVAAGNVHGGQSQAEQGDVMSRGGVNDALLQRSEDGRHVAEAPRPHDLGGL